MKLENQIRVSEIVEILELTPHIEGGYFREHFKSAEFLPEEITGKNGQRAYLTLCYYLLQQGDKSIFHRLTSDEIWSYQLGGPLHLFEIHDDGTFKEIIIGPNLAKGHQLNHIVKKNTWIGALPDKECDFSLVNATVYPGFEFEDWEKGDPSFLKELCPKLADIIEILT